MVTAWAVSSISPIWPGTQDTPAACANFLLWILSPIAEIAPGLGPMKTIPSSAHLWANSAFSDRKPKPGCTAWAPVCLQAAMILSATR
jgi:hypothetical protein